MRISARCDYACKALLELSLHWPKKEPLQIQRIANNQKIPMRYLVQILIQLKRLGHVESIRGKEGGYTLAKNPSDISLGDILRGVGGELLPVAPSAMKNGSIFTSIWDETKQVIEQKLNKVTFDDILRATQASGRASFYQI